MYNIHDLTTWRASQFEVDKMNKEARHREPELVRARKAAWKKLDPIKILEAFDMRKDRAQEAIDTEGWCPMEGRGLGGAGRIETGPAYRALLERIKSH